MLKSCAHDISRTEISQYQIGAEIVLTGQYRTDIVLDMNNNLINGKRQVWDVIISTGSEEYAQAWGLNDQQRALDFCRSLDLPDGWTRQVTNRWEAVG